MGPAESGGGTQFVFAVPATDSFGGGPLTHALLQGFAVLSSDAGHTLAQGGPAFGLDPQARLDYGYQAVGTLTPMAKQLIAALPALPSHSQAPTLCSDPTQPGCQVD